MRKRKVAKIDQIKKIDTENLSKYDKVNGCEGVSRPGAGYDKYFRLFRYNLNEK